MPSRVRAEFGAAYGDCPDGLTITAHERIPSSVTMALRVIRGSGKSRLASRSTFVTQRGGQR